MRILLSGLLFALLSLPAHASGGGSDAAKFHKPEEDTSLRFIPLNPNIITNFQRKDGKKLGVVQAQIQLTTKTNAGVDLIYNHLPLLRDRLIILLSSQTEEQVKDLKAREVLKASALAELRKLLMENGGDEETLTGVLFTGFMYQ